MVYNYIQSNIKNYKLNIRPFGFNAVYLNIDGKEDVGTDPLLRISHDGFGYSINGIYGFGGLGYRGPISTQTLRKGLRKLGFNITARQLRKLFK